MTFFAVFLNCEAASCQRAVLYPSIKGCVFFCCNFHFSLLLFFFLISLPQLSLSRSRSLSLSLALALSPASYQFHMRNYIHSSSCVSQLLFHKLFSACFKVCYFHISDPLPPGNSPLSCIRKMYQSVQSSSSTVNSGLSYCSQDQHRDWNPVIRVGFQYEVMDTPVMDCPGWSLPLTPMSAGIGSSPQMSLGWG